MTHYDTLGCKPDATAAELKAAARRAASTAHPDRPGGSDASMALVNKARDVLLDPERRAHYDATGEDHAGPTTQDTATQLLVEIFSNALERDGHIVSFARRTLNDGLKGAAQEKAGTLVKISRLEKRRGKVKVKRGDNLVDVLIAAQLERHRALLMSLETAVATATHALELLDAYEEADEPIEPLVPKNDFDMLMRKAFFMKGFP